MAVRWNLLSCKHFSELASKKLDQPLTTWEKFFFRSHYLICLVCRRFFRQMNTIDSAARDRLSDEFVNSKDGPKLSEGAKRRIAELLTTIKH